MSKVAFIGLGVMGFPMAGHLATRGQHDVTVYNRTPRQGGSLGREVRRTDRRHAGGRRARRRFRLHLRRQ